MRISLVSGLSFEINRICLYNEAEVVQINKLRALAAGGVGARGPNIGVIGTPGLTFFAEAAALSFISSAISSTANKNAVLQFNEAHRKYEMLLNAGEYLSINEISGLNNPDPASWLGWRSNTRFVHSGDEFVSVEAQSGTFSIRWRDVCVYAPPAADQFLDKEDIRLRWASIIPSSSILRSTDKYLGIKYAMYHDDTVAARDGNELLGFPTLGDFQRWADSRQLAAGTRNSR